MAGCGNDPRTRLTEQDRQAVREFRQWLRDRAQAREQGLPDPPAPDGMTRIT